MSQTNFFIQTPVAKIPYSQIGLLVAYQTLSTTNNTLTAANGDITIKPANYTFNFRDYRQFDVFPYQAGQAQVSTITFSSVTVVANQLYSITIRSGDGSISNIIGAVAPDTTTTGLASAFNTAFANANLNAFTCTVLNSVITFTETNASTGGFTFVGSDSNIAFANTTANIQPSGTLAQVQAAGLNVTAGQYRLYLFRHHKTSLEPQLNNRDIANVYALVYVNESDGNFATVDTNYKQFDQNLNYLTNSYSRVLMANVLAPEL